jgi:SHS2 domain-containing protein
VAAPRVQWIEHTADVGFDIEADTLPALFQRAATAMFEWMVGKTRHTGRNREIELQARSIRLQAEDSALLLAAWLRALLYDYATEGLCPIGVEFEMLNERELDASVTCTRVQGRALRESRARPTTSCASPGRVTIGRRA